MTGSPSKPWKIFLPLGAVLLLAALWSIYWFAASSFARGTFDQERARLSAQGVKFTCGDESWGGFPFRFEWSCDSLSIDAPSGHAESTRLRAVTLAYNPTHVLIFLDGPTSASAAGASFAANVPGQIVASLESLAGNNPRFSVDIPAASAGELGKASRILLHGRIEEGKIEFAAEAQSVSVNLAGHSPIDSLDIAFLASTPGDLATFGHLPSDLQEGRAKVTIEQLRLKSGTMNASGNGTFGLDANRRIAGSFSAETDDIDRLLAVLASIIPMKDSDRAMIRNMLAGPETPAPAKATFTAKDGALYWGAIPVGLLEPVY
ncbi:MAG: DUF2125 domain-containing protein [Rhizobiales bacterium]|nr:DUF2125 domain-containing protein [Hyphomicrobiales bacterium]